MAKEKMKVKFEKPPVYTTANGSLCIKADDIFHSQAGQDLIFRMTTIGPAAGKRKKDAQEQKKSRE